MRYPFVLIACSFAAGVLLAHNFSVIQTGLSYLGFALSLAACCATQPGVPSSFTRLRLGLQLSVLFAFLTAGALADSVVHVGAATNVSRWTGQSVRMPMILIGRVRLFSIRESSRKKFVLDVFGIIHNSDTLEATGTALVRIRRGAVRKSFEGIHPGDVLEVFGELRTLPEPRNPFDFDERAFLRSKGISALLESGPSAFSLIDHRHSGFTYRIERLRDSIDRRIVISHSSSQSRQLLPAILIGRRENIDPVVRDRFRRSGLSHLLAISGLHVGIIGFGLYWITGICLSRFGFSYEIRQRFRAILVIFVLAFYAGISGGGASAVRAVIMAAVFISGDITDRKIDTGNALGLAVLVILMLNPEDLFSPGLQLSVSALAGILFYLKSTLSKPPGRVRSRTLEYILKAISRRVSRSVGVTAFIVVFTMPVLLFHFGESPLGGLVSNIVAMPGTGLLLLSGIISTSVGQDSIMPFALFSEATDFLARGLVLLADEMARLVGAAAITYPGHIFGLAALLPLIASFLLVIRSTVNFRFLAVLGILVVLIIHTVPHVIATETPLSASFFDVGQGDAALFVTPGGKSLLVDTGKGYSSAETIRRHMEAVGLSKLDAVVITHPHIDHVGGLSYLKTSVDVRQIYSPVDERALKLKNSSSAGRETPITRIQAGDMISMDPSVRIQILAPGNGWIPENPANDDTIVMRLVYGMISFLLMGDAERPAEIKIIRQFGPLLSATVVKVGHHGSKTSSILPLVRRVTGRGRAIAVVSAGERNGFGHPDRDVMRRWARRNALLHLTSRSGALLIQTDGKGIRVVDRKESVVYEQH